MGGSCPRPQLPAANLDTMLPFSFPNHPRPPASFPIDKGTRQPTCQSFLLTGHWTLRLDNATPNGFDVVETGIGSPSERTGSANKEKTHYRWTGLLVA